MSMQRFLWLLLAAGHLTTVVCGASYLLPNRSNTSAAQIIRWYKSMSGAGGYGFFAPEVGAKHRARFLLRDEKGSKWWDVFDQASSQEVRLRLAGIVEDPFMSGKTDELPEWRKRLVTSWAATMFSRHPSAVSLSMVVEFYDIPTIPDFRNGARPTWETNYRASFQRQTPTASRSDR